MREIGDGTRRFFRTKGKPTPVKRISSRRIVARFFHPELVAFINPPLLHSVFIQDERFDKTENLHDVNPSPLPLSAFSDNWLPSFSFRAFRWLPFCAKKCTNLIRATFTDEAGRR